MPGGHTDYNPPISSQSRVRETGTMEMGSLICLLHKEGNDKGLELLLLKEKEVHSNRCEGIAGNGMERWVELASPIHLSGSDV